MAEFIGENCGFVVSYSMADAYNKLMLLQHRGQDAAGFMALGRNGIDVVKYLGSVDSFSLQTLDNLLPGKDYRIYAGHVRYTTKGEKDTERKLQGAHPHVIGGTETRNGSHVIVRGSKMAAIHNGQIDPYFLRNVDRSCLQTNCDTEAFLLLYKMMGAEELVRQIPAAYSAVFFDAKRQEATVIRDRYELRPLCMGKKDGKYEFASETRALEKHQGKYIRDVRGGEAIRVSPEGEINPSIIIHSDPRICFFEATYLQHPDSLIRGKKVSEHRKNLGIALEHEHHPCADYITYLPESPEFAAMGYSESNAERTGRNFDSIFLPIFYKPKRRRTFIESTQSERETDISKNLFLFDNLPSLKGKKMILIDDSIVRGTEIVRAVKLLRNLDPAEVHVCIYTPPVGVEINGLKYGCEEGVDMPPNPEIPADPTADPYTYAIRKFGSPEKLAAHIGADSVNYISLKSMLGALEIGEESCHRCLGADRVYAIATHDLSSEQH